MPGTIRFCIAVSLLFSLVAFGVQANRESVEDGTNDFNYVYGAVLGTGYYKSQTERLLILRIPLSHQIPWSRAQMRLLAPIAVGPRDTREQEAETSAPDNFSSLSIMPGLAMTYTLRDNWQISPLAQVGFAWEFKNNSSSWVGTCAWRIGSSSTKSDCYHVQPHPEVRFRKPLTLLQLTVTQLGITLPRASA